MRTSVQVSNTSVTLWFIDAGKHSIYIWFIRSSGWIPVYRNKFLWIDVIYGIFDSLAPARCGSNFEKCNVLTYVTHQIHEHLLWNCSYVTTKEQPLMEVNTGSGNGLCCQATSHYLNQCWSRSMVPYGATRPHHNEFKGCWCKICWNQFQHYIICQKPAQQTSHRLPTKDRYVFFVSTNSDWGNAWVTAMLYGISCYIWSHYNSTQIIILTIKIRLWDLYTAIHLFCDSNTRI